MLKYSGEDEIIHSIYFVKMTMLKKLIESEGKLSNKVYHSTIQGILLNPIFKSSNSEEIITYQLYE